MCRPSKPGALLVPAGLLAVAPVLALAQDEATAPRVDMQLAVEASRGHYGQAEVTDSAR